jgi:hypothetical protein
MTIENLKNSAKLFVEGNIIGEEFSSIFEIFHKKYFDYNKLKNENSTLADLIEEINEDISRYEPNDNLRLEKSEYYINEEQLRSSVKRLVI